MLTDVIGAAGARAAIQAWKDGVGNTIWSHTLASMTGADDAPVLERLECLGFV